MTSARSTVISGIGLLVTNDPEAGDGLLGMVRDAYVVVAGGVVGAVGTGPAPACDESFDVGGACVIPGFVDSHTHLVFAGDRSEEFARRMAGEPYGPDGIATTVHSTRQATRDELRDLAVARRAEGARGGTTTVEVKSGYGLTGSDERRLLEVASGMTTETTLLAAHVVPPEFGAADDYVTHVCDEIIPLCSPVARWVDVFCERGAFDEDQSRAVLEAGVAAGLGPRIHANQLGPGPGIRLAVELGCASADHCTFTSPADIDALAAGSTVATLLPATEFSTRQPYPDARALLDAGATVALATNTNPGSSNTTSMAFCLALAVREMGMTMDEALLAATAGGAAALRRGDVGTLRPGCRADLAVLASPTYTDFVYRPGVPLVAATMTAGKLTVW